MSSSQLESVYGFQDKRMFPFGNIGHSIRYSIRSIRGECGVFTQMEVHNIKWTER